MADPTDALREALRGLSPGISDDLLTPLVEQVSAATILTTLHGAVRPLQVFPGTRAVVCVSDDDLEALQDVLSDWRSVSFVFGSFPVGGVEYWGLGVVTPDSADSVTLIATAPYGFSGAVLEDIPDA